MADVIEIEGGVISLGNNLYEYRYGTVDGYFRVTFTSTTRPKIGDKIVNGVNEPLVGYESNQDKSRWIKTPPDVWPEDKF